MKSASTNGMRKLHTKSRFWQNFIDWSVIIVVVVYIFGMGFLMGSLWPATPYVYEKPVNIVQGEVSAYTSSPDETDDTPYITASGAVAGGGIVANNCLDFKSIVRIAGRNYVVHDRMNRRYKCNHFDIWFKSKAEAREFGRQFLRVIIISNNKIRKII